MRALWNGSLEFGLVNIPIHVYSASEAHGLEFDLLHKKDLSPIRYARVCKQDGKEIPYPDIVKGYEYEKGEYVVVEEDDFKKANAKKTSSILILKFSKIDEIDPIYFEKPYYLEPDKKAGSAYALLREVLQKSKRIAIVSFVFHHKEHIGMIRAVGNVLLLVQMRFQSQIRSFDDLTLPKRAKTDGKEFAVALKLIEQLTAPFHPEDYRDTYTEELIKTIEAKVKGAKPAKRERQKPSPKTTSRDLMQLLKQSLASSLGEDTIAKKKVTSHRKTSSPKRSKRKS